MPVVITGNNTPTAGGVVYGDGSTYATTTAGTSGRPIVSGGAGAPTFRPYTLPAADGSANQLLQTDGAGALSFATVSAGFTLDTPVATTSGTSIDFTSIPAGVKQIVISFNGVSTNGTTTQQIQIGDAGGVETASYLSFAMQLKNATTPQTDSITTGFGIYANDAAIALLGTMVLTLENASSFTWVASGVLSSSGSLGSATNFISAGRKSLSQELDRVRITTVSGTDTFDAGEINIAYI